MISLKGLFYPLAVVRGNTLKFSLDFTIAGVQQTFADYTFIGNTSYNDSTTTPQAFTITQNPTDPNLIDVELTTLETRQPSGRFLYEIKAVNTVSGDVRTLMQGPFILHETEVSLG